MLDRLIGNRSPLPFPLLLSLRSQLLRQRVPTVLTILALAAGVALGTSVELATRSVRTALERTASSLVGSAELEVTAGDAGVPDELVEPLREVAGVASASPLIQHTFRVAEGPRRGEAVRVVGIDLIYESEVRRYQVSEGGFAVRDPLRLVAAPNAIVISEALARRLGVGEGDAVTLRSPRGTHRMRVRGTLSGSLSEAFGGQIAVMDVFSLQELLGMDRRVDRIDVALAPGHAAGDVRAAIERQVGDRAQVRPSDLRAIYVDSVLDTLNASIWAIAVIGILLALFLTYSVTSLSVDRRVEELALLRAAGMLGRSVSALVIIDVAVLAAAGSLLGLAAAVFLSDPLIGVFSRASDYLQHVRIEPVRLQASTLWVAFGMAVPVALLASIEPAVRAGVRAPLDVLHGYRLLPSAASASRPLLAVGVAAALLAGLLSRAPDGLPASVAVAGSIALGVLAVGAGVTQVLLLAFRPLQHLLGRLVPRVGYLVGSYVLERPVETGATLAVWAAVTGGLLAIFSMVHSLVVSIDDFWIGLNGPDVVMTFAQDPLASRDRELIRNDTIQRMHQTPGVTGVAEYYVVQTLVRGEEVALVSLATDTLVEHSGGAGSVSRDPEQTIAALRRGEVVMNDAFARHFGVHVGDEIGISTARGIRRVRVGGFAHAYVGRSGALYLDIHTFRSWFDPPGAPQVALWTEQPRQEVLDRVQRASPQPLFFRHGDLFARHTALVVGKFSDLLLVPASLIGAIGIIALLNLLFGNVVARRRDLRLIRTSGGTSANLMAMVLANGLVVGLVGTACGLALGIQWSGVVSGAVGQSLGYHVELHLDWAALAAIAAGGLGLALVSGLGPALVGRGPVSEGYASLS